jgi:hypothetical protein
MSYKYAISTCVDGNFHSVLLLNNEPSNVFGPNDLLLMNADISIHNGIMNLKGTVIPLMRIHNGPIGNILHITKEVYESLLKQFEPQFIMRHANKYTRKNFLGKIINMISLPVALYPLIVSNAKELPDIQLISTSFSIIDVTGSNVKGLEW